MKSQRPRALIFSSISLGTGSGLRANYLTNALIRLGWEASLISPGLGPLPYSSELFFSAPYFALRALAKVDLLVAIKPYPNAWLAAAIAQARGTCVVLDVDDLDSGYRQGVTASIARMIQAPAFALPILFSTHHPALRQHMRSAHRVPPERIIDLPQGVDLTVFDPRLRERGCRNQWREALGLKGQRVLLFAAHLNVACQLDLTLKWLTPWLSKQRKVVLVVAGGGPDLARYKELAAPLGSKVRFLGAMTPHQVAQAMGGADLGLSAYGVNEANQYRVPMKIAEYLAMGLPVVSNLVAGFGPLARYIHVARGDGLDYSKCVRAALRRSPQSRSGQRWVRSQLNWDKVAQNFLRRVHALGALKRGA